jgi:hypothetical protein
LLLTIFPKRTTALVENVINDAAEAGGGGSSSSNSSSSDGDVTNDLFRPSAVLGKAIVCTTTDDCYRRLSAGKQPHRPRFDAPLACIERCRSHPVR